MATGATCLMVENRFVFFTRLGIQILLERLFQAQYLAYRRHSLSPISRQARAALRSSILASIFAAMAPLLCGYIGETYGWEKGFGLATVGMLVGLAVFVVAPWVPRSPLPAALPAASTVSSIPCKRNDLDGCQRLCGRGPGGFRDDRDLAMGAADRLRAGARLPRAAEEAAGRVPPSRWLSIWVLY